MCVSSQMYTLGRKSSLSSENLSYPTTASTPRLNVAIYNFPLPSRSQRPWGSRSGSLSPLSHGKRVKIHHAFETVVEVPEELEQEMGFDSTISGPEEVPRVQQIVAEIMGYLSAGGINDTSSAPPDQLPINRPSSPEPGTPRPTKPPPRPPTPYPRPEPDSDNMIQPDEAMALKPKPKPLPGPPGPPPPYPPPPIPQALGKSHHGAELYSNNGDIRLRMVRAARLAQAPPNSPPKNHTLLKLSLEDQRWGVMPRAAGAAKPNVHTTEGSGDETSFKYDPAGREWCAIDPILRYNCDSTPAQEIPFTAASSEAYCEKQQPISTGFSVPRYFQDPLNDTIHCPNSVAQAGFPNEWEFSPKLYPANSNVHYTMPVERKQTMRDLFVHPKMSFSKLRSVASMGSLKKTAFSREEGGNHTARVSSTSVSSTSSYSTSPTTASPQTRKGMEANGNKASIAYISIESAEAGYSSLYTTSLTIKPTSPFSACATTASINSSRSQQDLGEKMSSASASEVGAAPQSGEGGKASTGTVDVIPIQPKPPNNLREVPSEEFMKMVQLRKEMAKQNIIALEEKTKPRRTNWS